jgi:hypothetical protein
MTELKLYFMPFLDGLDHMKKFRVFVYQGEITAISQQSLYDQNPWLTDLDQRDQLEDMIRERILLPFQEIIKPKMSGYLDSYTMDFALVGESLEPYFIEPNSWGGAGSALFGWIQDHDMLHDKEVIEFRYVIADNSIMEEYYQDQIG